MDPENKNDKTHKIMHFGKYYVYEVMRRAGMERLQYIVATRNDELGYKQEVIWERTCLSWINALPPV